MTPDPRRSSFIMFNALSSLTLKPGLLLNYLPQGETQKKCTFSFLTLKRSLLQVVKGRSLRNKNKVTSQFSVYKTVTKLAKFENRVLKL